MTPENALLTYIVICYVIGGIVFIETALIRCEHMNKADKFLLAGMPLVPVLVILALIADAITFLTNKLLRRP